MPPTYEFPRGVDAPAIRPNQKPNILEATTPVLIVFRGGPPVCEMYDSIDYVIPPIPKDENDRPRFTIDEWKEQFHPAGRYSLEYGIARHLQSRAIVPGTRDPANYKKHESQIGIPGPGLDKPEKCDPFTEAQLEKFGGLYRAGLAEGIDRTKMLGPERNAQLIGTQAVVQAAMLDGRSIDGQVEDAIGSHVEPVVGGEGLAAVQRAEALAVAQGHKDIGGTQQLGEFADDPSKRRRGRTIRQEAADE